MKSPKSSPRPTAKPMAKSARPMAKPADMAGQQALARGNRAAQREASDYKDFVQKKAKGGCVSKMAKGGMCRGMGAAKKGGKYGKSG